MVVASQIAEMLVIARERKNFSIEHVSKALSLRPFVIECLERGDFEKLGALLYVRSYLRKYGSFLGLDMTILEPLILQLPNVSREDLGIYAERPTHIDTNRLATRPLFKWYLVVIIILALIGIITYFYFSESISDIFDVKKNALEDNEISLSQSNQYSSTYASDVVSSIALSTTISSEGVLPPASEQVGHANQYSYSSTISESQIERILGKVDSQSILPNQMVAKNSELSEAPDREVSVLNDSNLSSLVISVVDICWTHIVDSTGTVVISENLSPNQIYHLTGVSPFKVRFGNARAINNVAIDGYTVDQKVYRPNPNTTVITFKVDPTSAKNSMVSIQSRE